MDINSAKSTIELLNDIAQLVGIPVGIAIFALAKKRERIDREKGTFDSLGERYSRYLAICLENLDIPVFDTNFPANVVETLNDQQILRTKIVFCELISLLESAFLLYEEHKNSQMHSKQWDGWLEYAKDYFHNPAFKTFWPELSPQFDQGFVSEMNKISERLTN